MGGVLLHGIGKGSSGGADGTWRGLGGVDNESLTARLYGVGHKLPERSGEHRLFIQGDCSFAVNDVCVVVLREEARTSSTVTFFTYRWHQSDKERAIVQGEVLRQRISAFKRKKWVSAFDLLTGIAGTCLEGYQLAQRQGWMHRIDPAWEHDCKHCIYLGPMTEADEPVKSPGMDMHRVVTNTTDLYYCPVARPYPTVIARTGSRPSEYQSGILFGIDGFPPELNEAYRRAQYMCLLSGVSLPMINVLDSGKGSGKSGAWYGRLASDVSGEMLETWRWGEGDE